MWREVTSHDDTIKKSGVKIPRGYGNGFQTLIFFLGPLPIGTPFLWLFVADASTVNAFKARLDKFWSHQAVKFDLYSRPDWYRKPIRRIEKVMFL